LVAQSFGQWGECGDSGPLCFFVVGASPVDGVRSWRIFAKNKNAAYENERRPGLDFVLANTPGDRWKDSNPE
jgi:hypothetical protein